MATAGIRCRLVGGPFDGSTGRIDINPPRAIFAYPCPTNPVRCGYGGIHWSPQWMRGAEPYRRGEIAEDGVQLYTWGNLAGDLPPAQAQRSTVGGPA